MPTDRRRVRQHLVSRGYQANFALDGRVVVIGAGTGEVIAANRPIKENWVAPDVITAVGLDGAPDDSLEREFARHERRVLNLIRDIRIYRPVTDDQRKAVDIVAAIHLARSEGFIFRHRQFMAEFRKTGAAEIADGPEYLELFRRSFRREPRDGELEQLARRQYDRTIGAVPAATATVEGVRNVANRLVVMLGRHRMQLVASDESGPGFILSDQPVVHAHTLTNRYGFRDRLAVGDADLVMLPLSRRLLACYTAAPLRHVTLRTKKAVRTVNAAFVRNALLQVACHPADSRETSRLVRCVDDYPPAGLRAGTLK